MTDSVTPSTSPIPIVAPGTPREVLTGIPNDQSADGAASSTRNTLLVVGSCVSLQFGAAIAVQLFPDLGSWGVTVLRLGLAAVILLVVVRPDVRGWTRRQWAAVLASVLPYSLELSALRRLPAPVFSILLSLEPAFAALFGWLLLGQESGLLRNLAILLVIVASAGVTLTARRPPVP